MKELEAQEAPTVSHRVLIVDDEVTIRIALRRYFVRIGWMVDEAPNGESALDLLLQNGQQDGTLPYSVVICDLRMPRLSGIQLYNRLRVARPEILSRMVFSTGDVATDEAAEFVRTTASAVLQKPFELSALRAVVDRIVAG